MQFLKDSFDRLMAAYRHQPYPDLQQRQMQLKALRGQLLQQKAALLAALNADFGQRSASESQMLELLPSVGSIDYSLKRLKKWLKPEKRHVSWLFLPAKNYVVHQPLGVVGIIVPWNYPVFLSLGPLVAAVSAGNKVMLKLSEFTPQTNQVLKNIIETALPDTALVIEGDASVAAAFSQLPFAHLLYTGSTAVGYQVMRAASANLTPVTLELGGKSPLIIAPDANINQLAERIVFGKTANAGQTCVAPDYLLVPKDKIEQCVSVLQQQFLQFYPLTLFEQSYPAIINERHYQRLQNYLTEAKAAGARVISCLDVTPKQQQQRLMPLTLVLNAPLDSALWREEIFGPVLPVYGYQHIEEALHFVQQRPKPLALYLFSDNSALQQQVLQHTHAGGVCINETLIHAGQEDLPFGGIGPSGIGAYHGKEGFLTFSHAKAVHQKGRFNTGQMAYPQHRAKLFDKLLNYLLRP
ncbi:MAG TPA: coniferyl-aldehyde dehydrogenase [Rheinheimera sp.]|uniref:coniferyl aldehyde dehydrogenase n=1 Tax=Rheinheimera sp. TaxID=1869214 RepID=UPI000ED4B7FB|nr:coniferyl aldehyde dehydrogenase [Rheinheimera sp.]HCU64733.1 coniferyl-aldehyde dehydrogenase [Rheinheimera sp.]